MNYFDHSVTSIDLLVRIKSGIELRWKPIRAATPRISATASPSAVKIRRQRWERSLPEARVYSEVKFPAMWKQFLSARFSSNDSAVNNAG